MVEPFFVGQRIKADRGGPVIIAETQDHLWKFGCFYNVVESVPKALDRALGHSLAVAKWLVVPVVILLFLQWPLRDLVQAYSREANDLGQWIFALFMAAAVTAATRERIHLAADTFSQRYAPARRALIARLGALAGLAPWALFVLYASRQGVTCLSWCHPPMAARRAGARTRCASA